jgi:hypothetical protein
MIQVGYFEDQLIKVIMNCYIPQISFDIPRYHLDPSFVVCQTQDDNALFKQEKYFR